MKIGILTFHSTDNYGAMLQAYALSVVVRAMGFDCEIIDYRHKAITHGVEVLWPKDLVQYNGLIKGSIKAVNRWRLGWFNRRNKDVKFNRFMNKRLPLSKKTYRTPEELCDAKYDAVLFGSDQIWNAELTRGFAPEYFGKGISSRKIAYAASSGTDNIIREGEVLLRNFSALGIREQGLTDTLRNKGFEAYTVLDPVLLLTPEQWRKIEAPLPQGLEKGRYIFVYTFDEQPVYDLARKISEEEGLPIVIVRWCGKNERFNDMIQMPDCSPEEFLTLIDQAAVVCTSSFHGTAFSVLFEKRFYCCTPDNFGSRTNSLLSQVGLLGCRVEKSMSTGEMPDYRTATEQLSKLREQSLLFLKNAINSGE